MCARVWACAHLCVRVCQACAPHRKSHCWYNVDAFAARPSRNFETLRVMGEDFECLHRCMPIQSSTVRVASNEAAPHHSRAAPSGAPRRGAPRCPRLTRQRHDDDSSLTGKHGKGQKRALSALFAQLGSRYPREGRSIVQVVDGKLAGIKIIRPRIFGDDRGFFLESYSAPAYAAAGIDTVFVQDNHSRSVKGTLRGVHYQSRPGQAKLVRVVLGRIWDVMVDIRRTSPTFGRWEAFELDDDAREQLFIPIGFAHGFCVLSDVAEVEYKVSAPYDPTTECSISYADPELAIQWPVTQPLLSARDQQAESFAAFRSRVQPY